MSELGCQGNIGAQNEMVLVGGYMAKHFLRLIRKYIDEYVRCTDCKSLDTLIVKEEKTRLQYLRCNKCTAARTVSSIQSIYVAKKRGDRKKAKMAE